MYRGIKLIEVSKFPIGEVEEPLSREAEEYPISASDLVEFARCPARWIQATTQQPAKGYHYADLVGDILAGKMQQMHRAVCEPETYQARVLVCPGCDSESESKRCSKCMMDRKFKIVDRPWNSRAKPCIAWAEDTLSRGQFPVRRSDYELAHGAADKLANDADVRAFMKHAYLSSSLFGTWENPLTKAEMPVVQRIDVIPHVGQPLDHCLGLLYVTRDAAHGRHANICHFQYHHVAAAMALDMANKLEDRQFREVLQIIVEADPPHIVARRRLSAGFIQEGRRLAEETLCALALARESGRYATFDRSEPTSVHGWTMVEHDPLKHEGCDKSDARFGCECTT